MQMPHQATTNLAGANMTDTHPFAVMKNLLQEQGWYVGWALPCCQTCAWQEVPYEHIDGPFKGQRIDSNKILFNHEQDCQMNCEYDESKDEYILPEGMTRDDYCTIPAFKFQDTKGSLFCFNSDELGLKNLIDAIPVIKSSGCTVEWNKQPNTRIYIGWK